MREIKFRVWDVQYKSWCGNIGLAQDGSVRAFNLRGRAVRADRRERFEVMEYTGLKDNNGKEIYEGDIMRHVPDGTAPHLPFVVSWSEILLAWSVHDKPRKWCEYLNERKYDYVVIGNICENCDLLK